MDLSQSLSPVPCELQNLESPVNTLYYRGDASLLSVPKVSIVGARKAYPYTRMMTHNLALALSKRNVCVVSGGAMGVDAIAHEGAFPNTIAVLANGLDIIYPKVNRKLLEKIASDALL
jgi:DNA processing protein